MLLALTFLTCGVGLVQKDWCRDTGGPRPVYYAHACYSDIPPLYYGRGLADGEVPYIGQDGDRQVEYPVLTGTVDVAHGAARVRRRRPRRAVAARYFDINALGLARGRGRRGGSDRPARRAPPVGRRDVRRSRPTLALAGTINWDLYAVALLALGMLAWARERPVAAGVLIGLAAATKFYPLFLLGPLLVLCLRAGRMREFWTALRRPRPVPGRR